VRFVGEAPDLPLEVFRAGRPQDLLQPVEVGGRRLVGLLVGHRHVQHGGELLASLEKRGDLSQGEVVIPPEARADRDDAPEHRRASGEGVQGEETAEGVTGEEAIGLSAVVSVDVGEELLLEEVQEGVGPAAGGELSRCPVPVGHVRLRRREVPGTVGVGHRHDDDRRHEPVAEQEVRRPPGVGEVDVAVRHVEHGVAVLAVLVPGRGGDEDRALLVQDLRGDPDRLADGDRVPGAQRRNPENEKKQERRNAEASHEDLPALAFHKSERAYIHGLESGASGSGRRAWWCGGEHATASVARDRPHGADDGP